MHQMARFRHPKEKKMFFLIGRMRERSDRVRIGSSSEWTVFVNIETAARRKQNRRSTANWLAAALVLACLCAGVPTILGQSSPDQPPQTQQTQPAQDIPAAAPHAPRQDSAARNFGKTERAGRAYAQNYSHLRSGPGYREEQRRPH